MKRLIVSGTEYTPALDFDPVKLTMLFHGVSRPENVGLFYQQAVDWISDLSFEIDKVAPAKLKLTYKFEYCNSSTQKHIVLLLEKILELNDSGLEVEVDWFYEDGDEKMFEDGEDISDAIGVAFNFHVFE